jgi:hypothetical protein
MVHGLLSIPPTMGLCLFGCMLLASPMRPGRLAPPVDVGMGAWPLGWAMGVWPLGWLGC